MTNEVEPLILTNEIKKKKSLKAKEINENLSPAVRKIIVENNIDIEKVNRTGKDGRILKGDLIDMMGTNPQPSERKIKYGQEERIKMTRLRQTIAKRLKQAQENAALLTTFNEVDMTKIIEMRKDNKEFQQEKSDEINNSISEELEKLNELFKSGAISEEDFQKAKKKILD